MCYLSVLIELFSYENIYSRKKVVSDGSEPRHPFQLNYQGDLFITCFNRDTFI